MHASLDGQEGNVGLPVARPVSRRLAWPWSRALAQRISVAAVLLVAALFNGIGLASEGYANTYYAAAVRSMGQNWHNFFFVSFDPAGFVAVDKPPLGLWLQVASTKLFGYNGVAMLIPQGLAAVLSVLVLYLLVARRFGHAAGLLASLALALTPVAVVDNRNNTSDSVLICLLLLSAWAVSRAVESGRLRWLLLGAVLVGLGFNVKEFEAFLLLPPLFLLYLAGAPGGLLTRLWHLVVAGITTLVVSFSWIVAVDLTPVSQRPYVSDSGTNSELSLALGYNGFGRLATGLLSRLHSIPLLNVRIDGSIVPAIAMDIGSPGLFRLFRPAIGSQASWLLPLALLGVVACAVRLRAAASPRGERAALLFWATWLLAAGLFFSIARFYHLYYLILLAPPVSAGAGIGLVRLWQEYRAALTAPHPRPLQGWLLPLSVLMAGWTQTEILGGYTSWNPWLGPTIGVVCSLVAAALVMGRLGMRIVISPELMLQAGPRSMAGATILATGGLLIAPTAFAADSVANGNGAAWLPQAGPSVAVGFGGGGGRFTFGGRPGGFGGSGGVFPRGGAGFPTRRAGGFRGGGGGAITFAGANVPTLDRGLVSYLEAHRGSARYLVGTLTSTYASLFIIQTGQPVMTLGGYQGWDRILTLPGLQRAVKRGTIRYFLISGSGGGFGGPGGGGFRGANLPSGVDANLQTINANLSTWITTRCRAVPAATYSRTATTSSFGGGQGAGQLYDCTGAA